MASIIPNPIENTKVYKSGTQNSSIVSFGKTPNIGIIINTAMNESRVFTNAKKHRSSGKMYLGM
ncbi:hypothetical protein AGMMS49942_21550 [Spirochaetia bacterium]|nr:hypothetical protein AGMMS49942_21550 [Spirochaetia bacterium]